MWLISHVKGLIVLIFFLTAVVSVRTNMKSFLMLRIQSKVGQVCSWERHQFSVDDSFLNPKYSTIFQLDHVHNEQRDLIGKTDLTNYDSNDSTAIEEPLLRTPFSSCYDEPSLTRSGPVC